MTTQNIVLQQISKRRCFPVPELGDSVFVRALSRGELDALQSLPPDKKTDFMLGCVLVNKEGQPVFQRDPSDDLVNDEDFANFVAEQTQDVDSYTIETISNAVTKIGKIPPAETIVKN